MDDASFAWYICCGQIEPLGERQAAGAKLVVAGNHGEVHPWALIDPSEQEDNDLITTTTVATEIVSMKKEYPSKGRKEKQLGPFHHPLNITN